MATKEEIRRDIMDEIKKIFFKMRLKKLRIRLAELKVKAIENEIYDFCWYSEALSELWEKVSLRKREKILKKSSKLAKLPVIRITPKDK